MATSLNGVTFPLEPPPGGCRVGERASGERVEMADGSVDYRPANSTGVRLTWAVQVDSLTTAEVSTLRAAYLAGVLAGVTFVTPGGGSYTVRSVAGSWSEEPDVQGGVLRQTVKFQLEEAG